MRNYAITFCCLLLWPLAAAGAGEDGPPAGAGDAERIRDLEQRLAALERERAAAPPAGEAAPGSAADRLGRAIQSFNPDISAIVDLLFRGRRESPAHGPAAGEEADNSAGAEVPDSEFAVREVEFGVSGAVDPYARADLFLGLAEEDGEWGIELEEGYLTLLDLPADLQARGGKFRSRVGKANTMHTHSLPWPDYPAVINRFFGEEGMSEEGAEVTWLIPNPWDLYAELSYSAQDNGNEASFAGGESDSVMHAAHLKTFFELPADCTAELGGSFASGPNEAGDDGPRTNIAGVDLTLKWRPAGQELYRSLTFQGEVLAGRRDLPDGGTADSLGSYASLEFQFARRWSAYGRYDYAELPAAPEARENSASAGLTFAQSEYCFWRLGVEHALYEGEALTDPLGEENTTVFLQLNFGLGPHRAHQY